MAVTLFLLARGSVLLSVPQQQPLGHLCCAEGSQGSWDIDAHGGLLVLQQLALVKAESPHRYQSLAGTGKSLTDDRQLAQLQEVRGLPCAPHAPSCIPV